MSDAEERVDELETKVGRLEATVQGLTEELVEVHDRLETLESERSESTETTNAGRTRTRNDKSDESKSTESQEEDETGGDSELGDDIIVA
ncbi:MULTISPECIES: DUF7518 family protein [Halorussus]|uniref:DUF7518 family protein n=1 Tax=Halorussus TaxID=1070314 RepID=UPI00209C7A01|nr:bZIP transcription factor [Halorussus vallis]USZ75078.1 bZIP transcription factor [Halorussus vallis]